MLNSEGDLNIDTACVYLGGSCRNQPYCSHVCAANGLDFLNIPVALFVHQLEGGKIRKKGQKKGGKHQNHKFQIGVNCQFKFICIIGRV